MSELSPLLSDLFETLYRTHRLAGKSQKTVAQYRVNLRHLDRFLGRPAVVSDLSDENLSLAMQWLASRGRGPVTANKLRHHIIALWNFLARKRIAADFPTLQCWPEPKDPPLAWNEDQLRRLFHALAETPGEICGLSASEWHVCHNLVLWYSAERIEASLSIRMADCDFQSGWIRVRAKHRKGGTRGLMFRLPAVVLPTFRRFAESDSSRELLFPLDCTFFSVFGRLRRILKRAGLPHDRHSLYHRMRRSSISHFKRAGGNGTRLAGHSDENLTRDRYEDPTICPDEQGADRLFCPMDL